MDEVVVGILVALFVAFIVFLILRELMCWYLKVNKIVSLLEEIQASLYNLNRGPSGSTAALPQLTPDKEICPFCKEPSSKAISTCEVCGKTKR